MKRIEIAILILSLAIIVLSVGAFAKNANQNPLQERLTEFENELRGVRYVEEDLITTGEVNFKMLVRGINAKKILWQELIVRAPAPKRVAAGPNLEKMLEGVQISKRMELGRGANVKVSVKTPVNARGEWKSVGDRVNGLVISEITKESVTFTLKKGGKEYTHALPRT